MEDIPKALREPSQTSKTKSTSPVILMGGLLVLLTGAIALVTSFVFRPQVESSITVEPQEAPKVAPTPTPTLTPPEVNNLLGHLTYDEAPQADLEAITADQRLKLRSAAAQKFKEMQAAAQEDGIILVPISGYRSVEDQEYLFFEIKEQRGEVASKRAEVSAPPGYSEHHTGYAVDIGDGRVPATHLEVNFAKTSAFVWLQANAARYSFELSFPENNPQGISYEPWHWRFVGDTHSLETFYKARNLKESK